MRMNRTTILLTSAVAAACSYFAVTALRGSGRGGGRTRAPAMSEREQHTAEDFSTTRSAGPGAMRDPPQDWSRADETSDESFPASDPPPVGSRVD